MQGDEAIDINVGNNFVYLAAHFSLMQILYFFFVKQSTEGKS